MGLSEWKGNSRQGFWWNWNGSPSPTACNLNLKIDASFALFICVSEGTFCLAKFSIPNRWEEDRGTKEEMEQKLMSVSAVQCVCSWLGDPMNKSKFLSPALHSPLFSCSFFPPSLLLVNFILLDGYSRLVAWSVCLRSAGKGNAIPDISSFNILLLCSDVSHKILSYSNTLDFSQVLVFRYAWIYVSGIFSLHFWVEIC